MTVPAGVAFLLARRVPLSAKGKVTLEYSTDTEIMSRITVSFPVLFDFLCQPILTPERTGTLPFSAVSANNSTSLASFASGVLLGLLIDTHQRCIVFLRRIFVQIDFSRSMAHVGPDFILE